MFYLNSLMELRLLFQKKLAKSIASLHGRAKELVNQMLERTSQSLISTLITW